MTILEIAMLSAVAFCSSALTSVVGAGGGTVLLAIMLQFMNPADAIPVHGAVQLASNTSRIWLFRKHLNWPIIIRFSLLLPIGVVVGLWLFQGLSTAVVQGLIGIFILITLGIKAVKGLREFKLPLWVFVPVGFATGILNIIVGVIAPVLGVFITRTDLKKEQVVGTLGFFGFVGNLFKVVGFVVIGFSFFAYGMTILCMVPAAILGTRLGKVLLVNLNEEVFTRLFNLVLISLALKLILHDALFDGSFGGWSR